MRVAIVHERLTSWGGSENVLVELHHLFPDAPIHVAVLDREILPPSLSSAVIEPTGLQRLYRGGERYQHLLPLLPWAFSRISFDDPDLVITSHHAFANRIRPRSDVPVISYTHTPGRWIWDPAMRSDEIGGPLGRSALAMFAATQRRPDRAAAQRLRGVIANSAHVAGRVERWWGRSAVVVSPPVDTEYFAQETATAREDFFLLAGRLVPYKRPLVAIAAVRRAGVRLVVAGGGRLLEAVAARAGDGVEVLGEVPAPTLRDLMRRCRAIVFPGEEDFGIVPVEAQACGAPVVAPAVGGVLETVIDGVTGDLYTPDADDEVGALAQALQSFDPARFDDDAARRNAERFGPERFRSELRSTVEAMLGGPVDA